MIADTYRTATTQCGKVRKVMTLKTSEEVKMARRRERARERQQALQRTMLQAVEQAVVLPEPQVHSAVGQEIVGEVAPEVIPTQPNAKEWVQDRVEKLGVQVKNVFGSVSSLLEKARVLVLETD